MKKLLLALLMVPAMAKAEFYTGNDLYTKMTNEHSVVDRALSMGFVTGVYDVGVYLYFCPPKPETSITVGQVVDMSKNWLATNANRRNELAQSLLLEMFRKAWPCPTNRSNPTNGRGA